mmetsp:Transcript_50849/g.61265  ORF Transcript_50849/g.61265 Transcript_50849/m.61265 type:complete len:118 (+) Transcript_50849:424-777(+)
MEDRPPSPNDRKRWRNEPPRGRYDGGARGRGFDRWNGRFNARRDNEWSRNHDTNTHVDAARKEDENKRLRNAFGIRDDEFVEGAAFDRDLQEQKKRERRALYEERWKAVETAERKWN